MTHWLHNLAHLLGLTGGYVDHQRDSHSRWGQGKGVTP